MQTTHLVGLLSGGGVNVPWQKSQPVAQAHFQRGASILNLTRSIVCTSENNNTYRVLIIMHDVENQAQYYFLACRSWLVGTKPKGQRQGAAPATKFNPQVLGGLKGMNCTGLWEWNAVGSCSNTNSIVEQAEAIITPYYYR
jgi:hypothetical protein